MKSKLLVCFFCIAWSLVFEGCCLIPRYEQLMLLKRMSENRREMEEFINRQEERFELLKRDIENNRLHQGMLKEEVVAVYGEPVFCSDDPRKAGVREACLYRYPTEYFSSDRVFLYFDPDLKLCSWNSGRGPDNP